ncbi:MAG: SDR family oxidoreductase [Paludibacteraceae bacterium]|nr:SDR family oxidoreductase [Paludibacteraceae bacterium]
MRTLLITGGSSGIGQSTASLFAERGWRVFELSRHGISSAGITHVDCDVRDEDSVRRAVDQVLQQTDRLDVVISNAGFGISGPIEFADIKEVERQMDVNFTGAVRLVQAVLPQLRKQHGGRIIFTSSVAALLAVPYQSFYSASKAAINALALALANEVRTFGIKVSVMMPGDVRTSFTDTRNKSLAGQDIYTRAEKAVSAMEKDERNGMSPVQMARLFYHIATCRRPRPQYVGGLMYRVLCFLDNILPKRLVNWIEGQMYS